MFRPQSFGDLVRWFINAWRAEVPSQIHNRDTDAGGAPEFTNDFRTYIDGNHGRVTHAYSDGRPEVAETYVTPILWTLKWLERNRHPEAAKVLRDIGRSGGTATVYVSCTTCHAETELPEEYRDAILRDALKLADRHYREAPTTY